MSFSIYRIADFIRYTLYRREKKYRKIHIIVMMITIKPQYLRLYDNPSHVEIFLT